MNNQSSLQKIETFFMALADKTRLRLLNLMRHEEVCVCFFTEVLGDSQPKISRHLAYLRNAEIVTARRDGKWMHYSIQWPDDTAALLVLEKTLDWLSGQADLIRDREEYDKVCCSPEALVQIARSPMPFISARANISPARHTVDSGSVAHNDLDEFLL